MSEGKSPSLAAMLAARASHQLAESALRARIDSLSRELDDATVASERYKHFFDANDEPRLVADRMGTIREANVAACEALAIAPTRVVGKPIAVFIAASDRAILRTSLDRSSHESVRLIVGLCPRGKAPRQVVLHASPLPDASGALWCVEELVADAHEQHP